MTQLPNGAVVVGGGIAGAAAAIALAKCGVRVTVIERERQWKPASSGLFIYSNGLAALDRLGVLDDVMESGWPSPDGANLYLTAEGEPIVTTHYPRIGVRIPAIVGMRRVELHRVLASAVAKHGVEVRLGVTVAHIEDEAGRPVAVTLSDGSRIACDVVVGADGIRSDIRTRLFGAIEPHYTGFGVWRSTHAKPKSIDVKVMMMGVGLRLGIMPTSRDELYIFGTTREPGKPFYPAEQWPELMRAKFASFKGPVAPLLAEVGRAVSGQVGDVFYTSVEEVHLPLPWSRGRVVVIGDAAHSSSPFMGQGGALALEDAIVLAEMLTSGSSEVAPTLLQFGERRFERCKFVQDASRAVGEAGAIEDADASVKRNERMKAGAQGDVDRFYARMHEAI